MITTHTIVGSLEVADVDHLTDVLHEIARNYNNGDDPKILSIDNTVEPITVTSAVAGEISVDHFKVYYSMKVGI